MYVLIYTVAKHSERFGAFSILIIILPVSIIMIIVIVYCVKKQTNKSKKYKLEEDGLKLTENDDLQAKSDIAFTSSSMNDPNNSESATSEGDMKVELSVEDFTEDEEVIGETKTDLSKRMENDDTLASSDEITQERSRNGVQENNPQLIDII